MTIESYDADDSRCVFFLTHVFFGDLLMVIMSMTNPTERRQIIQKLALSRTYKYPWQPFLEKPEVSGLQRYHCAHRRLSRQRIRQHLRFV